MRRFYTIGGQAFCMIAALLLSLSPLSHGLHLASCDHSHGSCNTHHAEHGTSAPFCFQDKVRYTHGAENHRVATSCSQAHGCGGHDASTCPVCQTFAQLVKGQGPPPSSSEVEIRETCQDEPIGNQSFFYRTDLANGYARAPPAC